MGYISKEQNEVLQRARNTYGCKNQLVVAAEECNELSCALLKFIRYDDEAKGLIKTRQQVLEERADVEVILNHIDNLYGFTQSDIEGAISPKILRLEKWLDNSSGMEFTTVLRDVSPCETCFVSDHFETEHEQCRTCTKGGTNEAE